MKPWAEILIGAGFIGISYLIIAKLKENSYLQYIKEHCIDLSEIYKDDETKHMLTENKVYY